jgi:hypothetical protein
MKSEFSMSPILLTMPAPFAGLDSLIEQDAWAWKREKRLSIERDYRNLDIIFGNPSVDADDWLTAEENKLCMAIVKTPICAKGIAFTYDLNRTRPGSHAGGVLAYRGQKSDTQMLVVILQYNGSSTVGALWHCDLSTWALADQPLIMDLPNTGIARIACLGEVFILSVDEIEYGRFAVTGQDLNGGVGVGWSNARIRNIYGLDSFHLK